MARFKHYDYNQTSMVVISKKTDLSAFHEPYKNDREGRPAYGPAILLKIILFAYSKGIISANIKKNTAGKVKTNWIVISAKPKPS